jgi:hypothetical protein
MWGMRAVVLVASILILSSPVVVPAAAAARCPSYVLKSAIKELCWEGAWRPYERDTYRDDKGQKYKNNKGSAKPKWRFKSGQRNSKKSRS